MFIPGFLIAIVTFPGVIVHEIAHLLFCRFARVAVFDVCYFRIGNPSGYVVHEPPRNVYQSILIGIGPFFVNSIMGALIAFPAAIPMMTGGINFLEIVDLWLGLSIAMHAFPSTGDAKSIWASVFSPGTPVLARLLTVPLVCFIYLGAIGSFFWLDLIYGVVIAVALPYLLISRLA
jgi:hypothetical protein